jgi:hypothetical protein
MRIALLLAILVFVAVYGQRIARFLEIDACLDAGGRWDYEECRCEFYEEK